MKIESAVSIVWNNENLLIDAESGWGWTGLWVVSLVDGSEVKITWQVAFYQKFCGCWKGWSTFNFEGKNAKKGKGA